MIYSDFIKKIDKKFAGYKPYCFSVMKWPTADHFKNFSDIDLRIIIDTNFEEEILKVNDMVYELFCDSVKSLNSGINFRILEHPPGYLINLKELEFGLGDTIDINTWSFLHGNYKKYLSVRKKYSAKDLDNLDQKKLHSLFVSRHESYDLKLEPLYPYLNKDQYSRYCLVWHYYAVAIFAAAGLLLDKKIKGKSEALRAMQSYNRTLSYCDRKKLVSFITTDVSLSILKKNLKSDLDILNKEINKKFKITNTKIINNKDLVLKNFVNNYQMFRIRLSRYNYYFDTHHPTKQALIRREYRELSKIARSFSYVFSSFCHLMDNKKLYQNIEDHLNQFNKLISCKKINKFILSNVLKLINDSIINFEKFNYILLQNTFGGVSIDCLKIKVTPKCNNNCCFCIFSDNSDTEMDFETFLKIIKKTSAFHFNKIFINGGEPTLHSQFKKISEYIYNNFPHKEKILGTNCRLLTKLKSRLDEVINYYDTIAIGCDDEHRNLSDVLEVVPKFIENNKFVVINTLINFISPKNKKILDDFCKKNNICHVYNNLHHFCSGKRNKLNAMCHKYKDKSLLVLKDGSCFRCFNAVNKDNPDFNIFDKNFKSKLFEDRKKHYDFCYYCDEYC
ncbi:radical SAM protein [Patescibacteria group bacterium]|nr:radical SAM protein [Patescibacteria group bacterium]